MKCFNAASHPNQKDILSDAEKIILPLIKIQTICLSCNHVHVILRHIHRIASARTSAHTANFGKITQCRCSKSCIPQLFTKHPELFLTVVTCTKFFDIFREIWSDFYVSGELTRKYLGFEVVQERHLYGYKIVSSRTVSQCPV